MKLPSTSLCRGLFLTAFALVTFTAASAASNFEGRVHMDMTAGKKKDKMGINYTMKNGLLRMDMQMPEEGRRGNSGGMGGMIIDMEAREMIILMEMSGRKMFMRRPIPQPTVEQTTKTQESGHRPMSAPVATGRTEMIAGYKATEYRTTTEKGEVVEMWLAKGLGTFMAFSGGNPMAGRGAAPAGWENFVRDGNLFPMRMVMHDASGEKKMHMEVTSVEKGPVPDSLFSTDGYSEFQMPGFGGGGLNPFKKE